MYADLINMFLMKYPEGPCAVATFYPGQVLLDKVPYLIVLSTIFNTGAAASFLV